MESVMLRGNLYSYPGNMSHTNVKFAFVDPPITVHIYGSTRNYRIGSESFQGYATYVCSANNTAGLPQIQFSGISEDYRLQTLITNVPNPKQGIYHQTSLYADVRTAKTGNLTCYVSDRLGTYNESIPMKNAGKVAIDQLEHCYQH